MCNSVVVHINNCNFSIFSIVAKKRFIWFNGKSQVDYNFNRSFGGKMRNYKLILLTFVFLFLNNGIILSQESDLCQVLKKYPNGCLLIQSGNKTYLAITEAMEKEMIKMKQDLLDAEKKMVLKDSLLANVNQTINWYESTIKNMKAYMTELETVLKGYKGLVKDYKKLKEPLFLFKGGIGATGKDYKPAALVGLGIRDFSMWGFLQERNSGLFIGKQLRLY